MSQRDISATIDDIYGFKLSAEQISKITDYVLEEQENWQNRRLAPFYPFLFVDCLFVPIKRDYETFHRPPEKNLWCTEPQSYYPSAVRKIMYTTNAIEAVNSSFRKVTKRGAFSNDNSVFKALYLLYLRVVELQKKWADRPIANWSLVRNQLLLNDRLAALFDKFDR